MKSSKLRHLTSVMFCAALALGSFSGCSDDDMAATETDAGGDHDHAGGDHDKDKDAATSGDETSVDSKAADLRVTLNLMLSEHLILAAKATGAALGGRSEEFDAYGALLGKNGEEIGAMVGAAFGDEAETAFNEIWSQHNGFFVDYTTGVATKDKAKQDKAVSDLTTVYVPKFAKLIAGATGLPEKTVSELTAEHVITTKNIVDAQAKEDWVATYKAIRVGFAHMQMIGNPLSIAIAKKLPEAFPGDAETAAVDFRVALNELLQEHLFLASFATGAALGGRNDEFAEAGKALGENGTDLGAAIGGLYGSDAEDTFNEIWEQHNGFFVDYTTGVATKDKAKQDKAVSDLTTVYVPKFAKFLAGATDLPEKTLSELTAAHVVGTKVIVDAQAKEDFEAAGKADREGAHHMAMIGNPLAIAIVAKLPEKF